MHKAVRRIVGASGIPDGPTTASAKAAALTAASAVVAAACSGPATVYADAPEEERVLLPAAAAAAPASGGAGVQLKSLGSSWEELTHEDAGVAGAAGAAGAGLKEGGFEECFVPSDDTFGAAVGATWSGAALSRRLGRAGGGGGVVSISLAPPSPEEANEALSCVASLLQDFSTPTSPLPSSQQGGEEAAGLASIKSGSSLHSSDSSLMSPTTASMLESELALLRVTTLLHPDQTAPGQEGQGGTAVAPLGAPDGGSSISSSGISSSSVGSSSTWQVVRGQQGSWGCVRAASSSSASMQGVPRRDASELHSAITALAHDHAHDLELMLQDPRVWAQVLANPGTQNILAACGGVYYPGDEQGSAVDGADAALPKEAGKAEEAGEEDSNKAAGGTGILDLLKGVIESVLKAIWGKGAKAQEGSKGGSTAANGGAAKAAFTGEGFAVLGSILALLIVLVAAVVLKRKMC